MGLSRVVYGFLPTRWYDDVRGICNGMMRDLVRARYPGVTKLVSQFVMVHS
jgi:hypothetical protein